MGEIDTVVVIYFSEDGDLPIIRQMPKAEFAKQLKQREADGSGPPKFVKPAPEIDASHIGNEMLVIEGRMLMPKPVQVVTEYEL